MAALLSALRSPVPSETNPEHPSTLHDYFFSAEPLAPQMSPLHHSLSRALSESPARTAI